MSAPDPTRAEECRYEVRHYLAVRPTLAIDARSIHRGLSRSFDFTFSEVEAALAFLTSLDQVRGNPAALGPTRHYQITAAGTLAEERGE